MPFYLLTFRPQPSEYDLNDTFWTILKPALDDNPNIINYIITVEKDGTIDRHTHCLVEFKQTKSKKNQLQAFLNTQKFKAFNKMLRNVMTNLKWARDERKVGNTEEDLLYTIGYVLKEPQALRRHYTLTEERCVEGINYYYQNQKIDKAQPEQCNLRIMTSKNIHINILDFCRSNDIKEIRYPAQLKTQMRKEGYMFSQVNKVSETMDELDIYMNPDKYMDTHNSDEIMTYGEYKHLYEVVNKRLHDYNQLLKQISNMVNPLYGDYKYKPIYDLINKAQSEDYYFDSDTDEE